MSEKQSSLGQYVEDPNAMFGDVRDYIGNLYGRIRNGVRDIAGINLDWWAESPFNVTTDDDIWVYQFVVAFSDAELEGDYNFENDVGDRPVEKGSPSPELQFKTGVYVIGEPTQGLERHIKTIHNPRLVTLFNTREYAGYVDGFGFSTSSTYVQRERVSAREADQKGYGLGVPWFEVEAYDDNGELEGYADGYYNPFTTETTTITTETGEKPPQHEVWKVGGRQSHETGDRYQIAPLPNTNARKRAQNAAGKTAVINGFEVGSIMGEGRIRLKVEHKSPARATYASRKTILDGSGTPYQALSEGANIYKVEETDDRVIFTTTRPERFEEADPDDISPDAVGVEVESEQVTDILLDEDKPTQFTVETDEDDGRLLGLYDPVVVRNIERGTTIV